MALPAAYAALRRVLSCDLGCELPSRRQLLHLVLTPSPCLHFAIKPAHIHLHATFQISLLSLFRLLISNLPSLPDAWTFEADLEQTEISPNRRAGCQDTSGCKKDKVKIQKGEPRFGTWVEIEGRGSWRWKHW